MTPARLPADQGSEIGPGQLALLLGCIAVGLFLVTELVATQHTIVGSSMEPTLQPGDRVVVDVWTFRHRTPRPGEIVVLTGPPPTRASMIKRIAPESAASSSRVVVRGDNPADSADSRQFGPVPIKDVGGRVVFRYWPPDRMGPVR